MNKITLLALALLTCSAVVAQMTYEASDDYARLRDMTYDATVQDKIYASTLRNHIMVSYDNGVNWELLYSDASGHTIQDLELTPGNAALSFGTYDRVNLLDVSNGTLMASFPIPQSGIPGASPSYVISYQLYDSDASTMVVNTGFQIESEGGLPVNFTKVFYTNDGGTNWSEIYFSADHDNIFINDVGISPNNPDKIFLARANGNLGVHGGLLISGDAGQNWSETLQNNTLDAITFNPDNPNDMMIGSAYGGVTAERLYRSLDNGTTWNIMDIQWTDESLNNIKKIVFNPENTAQIIVMEENEIARTNDGGATWTNIVYPAGISTDYYYGTNASYNPFNSSQIAVSNDLYPQFLDNTTGMLNQIRAPFFFVTSVTAAVYAGTEHLYYGGQGGRHHKNKATQLLSAYDTQLPTIHNVAKNFMYADPSVAGRLFTFSAGFTGGVVNMSTDYGSTTINLMDAFAEDMQAAAVDPNNTSIFYVSLRLDESGNVFKIDVTDTGNVLWNEVVTPQVAEDGTGVVGGLVIDPTGSGILYICKGNKVFKTTDGGVNWTELHNGLDQLSGSDHIWNLVMNPLNANQLTIGTSIGIFTSLDSGENWSLVLADADVKKVSHSTLDDGVIVGSVYSTQYASPEILYTTDGGVNWQTITSEDLNYAESYDMDYVFNEGVITAYISTTDMGVLKYTIDTADLGTSNPDLRNPVGIYPNPASEYITVYRDDSVMLESVAVYSLAGEQLLESQSGQLNVSGLSDGVYLVKVESADGGYFTKKMIKK